MRWRIMWRGILLLAVVAAALALPLFGETTSPRQRYGLWLGAIAMAWIFGLELLRGIRAIRRAEQPKRTV